MIWLGNSDGEFTTRSAWDFVRVVAPKQQWSDWIWHAPMPKKILVIMWKALSQSLSVDDRIRRIGIPMVSKCKCREDGAFEDLNHGLYQGRMPAAIWRTCSNILGIPYVARRTWREMVEAWFRRTKNASHVGNLIRLIPIIITWRLWCLRCTARMEARRESIDSLWRSVRYWISWVGSKLKDASV